MIREFLSDYDENILLLDGFDDAIVGVSERLGQVPIALYDRDKIIAILMERDGMAHEEALEFFDFNIIGAYVGEYTPAFVTFYNEGTKKSL